MAVIQVSTREFREKQAFVLDLADKGESVIIRRGNKSYVITPITDEELYLSPKIRSKIKDSIKQAKEGIVYKMNENENLDEFLDRLGDVQD